MNWSWKTLHVGYFPHTPVKLCSIEGGKSRHTEMVWGFLFQTVVRNSHRRTLRSRFGQIFQRLPGTARQSKPYSWKYYQDELVSKCSLNNQEVENLLKFIPDLMRRSQTRRSSSWLRSTTHSVRRPTNFDQDRHNTRRSWPDGKTRRPHELQPLVQERVQIWSGRRIQQSAREED